MGKGVPERTLGFREGIKHAVRFLYEKADAANEPLGRKALNSAAAGLRNSFRPKPKT